MLNNCVIILFCALSFSLFFSFVQLQVGDSCNLPVIGNPGVCKPVAECPTAVQLNKNGIPPFICGHVNGFPIVCCEGISTKPKKSTTTKRTTLYTPTTPSSVTTRILNQKLRKCETKCLEYRKLVTHVVDRVQGITLAKEVPLCYFDSAPLIIGGTPAEPGEFPHMAILGYRNSNDDIDWLCGGSLISELYVLTAAHCTKTRNGQPIIVRLGELNLVTYDDGTDPEEFTISRVISHPAYEPPQTYNDIAVIRLSRPVKFNKFIRPACLWSRSRIYVNELIASGWGRQEYGGQPSDNLQKVSLGYIENNVCNSHYTDAGRRLPHGIDSTMLCAGNLTARKDTCQGDSGGPLQITSDDNQCLFYIIGVTSFGKGCGTLSPAIYTRLPAVNF
ncbi:snake [Carabus blaptoides fortunei]